MLQIISTLIPSPSWFLPHLHHHFWVSSSHQSQVRPLPVIWPIIILVPTTMTTKNTLSKKKAQLTLQIVLSVLEEQEESCSNLDSKEMIFFVPHPILRYSIIYHHIHHNIISHQLIQPTPTNIWCRSRRIPLDGGQALKTAVRKANECRASTASVTIKIRACHAHMNRMPLRSVVPFVFSIIDTFFAPINTTETCLSLAQFRSCL